MAGMARNGKAMGVGGGADDFFECGVDAQLEIEGVNCLFVLAVDFKFVEELHAAMRPAQPSDCAVPSVQKVGKIAGREMPQNALG